MACCARLTQNPALMAKPKGSRRTWWTRGLTIAVLIAGVSVLLWLLRRAGIANVATQLGSADLRWAGAAVGVVLLRALLMAWRIATITQRVLPCETLPFVGFGLAAQAVAMVTPGVRIGAMLMRALLASRRFGGSIALHLAPNLLEQMLLAASWGITFSAHLPGHLAQTRGNSFLPLMSFLLATAILTLGFFGGVIHFGSWVGAWLARPRAGWAGRLGGASAVTVLTTQRLVKDPRALLAGLGGGVLFALATGAIQWCGLRACGAEPTWIVAFFSVVLSGTASVATAAPGGVGVSEAVEIAYLSSQGLDPGAAAAGVLLARGIQYLFTLVGGGFFLWRAWQRGELTESQAAGDVPG